MTAVGIADGVVALLQHFPGNLPLLAMHGTVPATE